MAPIWESLQTAAASLLMPFVLASPALPGPAPSATAIPQDIQYGELVAGQIYSSNFSTDPTQKREGRVAGEHFEGDVEVFIINDNSCTDGVLHYRIIVRNNVPEMAEHVRVGASYHPEGTLGSTNPEPWQIYTHEPSLAWQAPDLAPKGLLVFTFSVFMPEAFQPPIVATATVGYIMHGQMHALHTKHVIDQGCPGGPDDPGSDPDAPPFPTTAPIPGDKHPAIICDPREINCVPFMPTLGIKFQNALSANDDPQLGRRYQEAIADIIPGECRVLADDIIITPEYHDALNRQARPAAPYMRPLYESGQDFRQLVHENNLLGTTNILKTRDVLRPIHLKHWQKQINALEDVLNGQADAGSFLGIADQWDNEWKAETQQAQIQLWHDYLAMQNQRRAKFDSVAEQAVANAQQSIMLACGEQSDGGLAELLPAVKLAYDTMLSHRIQDYQALQEFFLGEDVYDDSKGWKTRLENALIAFMAGDREPLEDYVLHIPVREQRGWSTAFNATYYQFFLDDDSHGHRIRLDHWNKALEAPKTVATDCEKETIFNEPVETTWCESGSYPEFIIKGAPVPVKAKKNMITLPDVPGDGYATTIDVSETLANACAGGTGDPWWQQDCICQCDELMPVGIDPATGEEILVPCQILYAGEITRHDIHVSSPEECEGHGLNPL